MFPLNDIGYFRGVMLGNDIIWRLRDYRVLIHRRTHCNTLIWSPVAMYFTIKCYCDVSVARRCLDILRTPQFKKF